MLSRAAPLLALAALLTACAPPPPAAAPAPSPASPVERRADNQVLTFGVSRFSDTLSPAGFSSNPWFYAPIYDSLTSFGPNFEVRPWLATKWELNADGTVWTFTLREDVRFWNGDPVTADDLAYTIDLSLKQQGWTLRTLLTAVSGVQAVDPKTLQITTRAIDLSIPAAGPLAYAMSKKVHQEIGDAGYATRPMGSGPYEVVQFQPGAIAHFRVRSTPHAFRKVENRELIFRNIVENSQLINGMRTGELDGGLLRNFTGEQAEQLRNAGMTVIAYLNTNASMKIPQGVAEAKGSPLADKRVREALNYAINREAMTQQLFKGFNKPTGQGGTPDSQYWDPSLPPWPYDPAKAKQLLAEAGYPTGFRLTGGLDFTPAAQPAEVPLAVQGYLREVGVEIEINSLELGVFSDKVGGRQPKGDIVSAGTGDRNGWFTAYRGTVGCNRPPNIARDQYFYCNPLWDQTFDAAVVERDPAKRAELYRRAARIERDDLWILFTYNGASYHVHSPKVKGIPSDQQNQINLDGAYRVQ
jgi:peptide/nickel transport system substrate-binding protein